MLLRVFAVRDKVRCTLNYALRATEDESIFVSLCTRHSPVERPHSCEHFALFAQINEGYSRIDGIIYGKMPLKPARLPFEPCENYAILNHFFYALEGYSRT